MLPVAVRIFSRVQHHWHPKSEKGERVPTAYCRPVGRKSNCMCKRGFPKKVLKDHFGKVRPETCRVRVVCQGVAAQLDLKTTGQRNALGSIVGKRQCEWFAPTSAVLAPVTRSNTNVQCNYRVPITETTHDKDCPSKNCIGKTSIRQLCLIAQRAMKQMTGYFGGYISKRQKIGQFELKKSVAALAPLKNKLQSRQLRASAQLAHVVNRMFITLEGKGILRASTEEFMLASRGRDHDQLAGEFIRTFRHQEFHGKFYLDYYDALQKPGEGKTRKVHMPRKGQYAIDFDEVSAYGYRPPHPDLFYLSPWEFVQWYKVVRLREPSREYVWSKWTAEGKRKVKRRNRGEKIVMIPCVDYVLSDEHIKHLNYVFPYPEEKLGFDGKAPEGYKEFRHTWLIVRRERPVVPCPRQTPLPGKRMSKERRAIIFSVYT